MSQSVKDGVERAAAIALAQRPAEVLQDDWEAAGLAEIGALVRSWWPKLGGSLTPLWAKAVEADVDLERLLNYRGKALHAVGQVNFESQRAEVAAIITRLRIGFEQVRRNLLPDELDWLPYLERIESPIEGLCWTRSGDSHERPTVRQGDRIDLRLIGVNPAGQQEKLRYNIEITGVVGGEVSIRRGGTNEFSFDAPRSKEFIVSCYVYDEDDPTMYDGSSVSAIVVPEPPVRY